MPILDYKQLIDRPYKPGQIVTLGDAKIWSYVNARSPSSAIILLFGLGVVKVGNDGPPPGAAIGLPSKIGATSAVDLPSGAGQIFEGVSYYTDTYEQRAGYSIDSVGRPGYPGKQVVSIARSGAIAVWVDTVCTRGQPVYMRHTSTSADEILPGCFGTYSDTSLVAQRIKARFLTNYDGPPPGKMGIAYIEMEGVI